MNKILTILAILFVLLVSIPYSSGLDVVYEDNDKFGDYGQEIRYFIEVTNDESNPKDFLLTIEENSWEVSITEAEHLNVAADEKVTFEVIVQIPYDTELVTSTTVIHLAFRNYVPILSENSDDGYELDHGGKLYTTIIEKETNSFSSKEIVKNTPIFMFLFGLLLLPSYLWIGRKYYFLTPLYTSIPKEKLLNHEKREMISHYLSDYNGSNLSEISQGTGINIQTLRHHMKLFEQSNIISKKGKRFFIKRPGSDVFDTAILSPVLQDIFSNIQNVDGITVSDLVKTTKRSKPWIGNRIHDLLTLDLIEIQKVGRFKYIYPKGSVTSIQDSQSHENYQPMTG